MSEESSINKQNAQDRLEEICKTGIQFRSMSLEDLETLIEETGLPQLAKDATYLDKDYAWHLITSDGAICTIRLSKIGIKLNILIKNVEGKKISFDEYKTLETLQTIKQLDIGVIGQFTTALEEFLEEHDNQLIPISIKKNLRKIMDILGFQ